MTLRHCLCLDLKDDIDSIKEYEDWHTRVWPEIIRSIKESGIENMQIYRVSNRLFMIMEVNDSFSFDNKAKMDAANPKVQEWETLMSRFQKPIPGAATGEKWSLMTKIFELP